ncbi:hypothetical protein ACUXCC_000749 [Cytobacillus horneckiae]
MMEFLAIVCGIIGALLTFNLLFSLLYLLSKTAGNGFYRWVVHDLEFLMILSFPFFGLTQYVASSVYERFNWFVARILLVVYAILLLIVAIIFFMLFSHFAESM